MCQSQPTLPRLLLSQVQGAEHPSGHTAAWKRGMDLLERELGFTRPFWKHVVHFCLSDLALRIKKQTKPDEENPPSTGRTFAKELSESWCQQHVLHSWQRNSAVQNGSINNGITGEAESWDVQGRSWRRSSGSWLGAGSGRCTELHGVRDPPWPLWAPWHTLEGWMSYWVLGQLHSVSSWSFQRSDPCHPCAGGPADHVASLCPDTRDLALLGCQIAQYLSCCFTDGNQQIPFPWEINCCLSDMVVLIATHLAEFI